MSWTDGPAAVASLSPVTLSVVRGALEQIADEMDLHLIRAAISPIISEMYDCGSGLFHARTGETIAQGHYGLPIFLASMQLLVQNLIPHVEARGGFDEGDVWIVNDPYFAGTHLSDIRLVAPYFRDGQLFALLATTGHMMDIGGSAAGGWAPNATDIHQEGLLIPPMRLYARGVLNAEIRDMILRNLRLPLEVGGDLEAMLNVFHVGRTGLGRLLDRYGVATATSAIDELMDRSEQQIRACIQSMPDGDYGFSDFLDNDGHTDAPIPVTTTLRVRGGELTFDFTGSAESPKGPMNLSRNTTISTCFVALKHMFPEVPVNGGTFRALKFVIPEGCIFAAEYPLPVGGYLEVVGCLMNTVFGAMAAALPGQTPAAWFGTTGVFNFSGVDPRTKRFFVSTWIYPGGYGGTAETDGLVHGTSPLSLARIMSFELSEHRAPIHFEQVALRPGSGGSGQHTGGCGSIFEITALEDCTVSVLGDRVDHQPFGILGGGPAASNEVVFTLGGAEWVPPMRSKVQNLALRPGDRIRASSPGGGGYGDPQRRPVEDVRRDVARGYITPKTARDVYGVALMPADPNARLIVRPQVDQATTHQLRNAQPACDGQDRSEEITA